MTAILTLRNGSFSYGGKNVFQELSLEISAGEVFCLLGPNGCGKTTLLRCLMGSLPLAQGVVKLQSTDISTLSEIEIARKIGFVFQSHEMAFPYPVLDVVLMGRAPHIGTFGAPSAEDTVIAEKALEQVGILHLKEKPYTQISGGERQMALIARTLAQEPEIILMDEPTSHLDFKNQTRVLQTVNRLAGQGLTIVMASHFPDHALLFSQKVAMMKNGSLLAAGTPSQIITDEYLGRLYEMSVSVITVKDPNTGNSLTIAVPRL